MGIQERSETTHLLRLDALRGAAIVGVLLFHCYNYAFQSEPLPWHGLWRTAVDRRASAYLLYPLTFGWTGISLFFVLSGFVIHYSRLRSKSFEIRSFFWRRFWRIYPAYLAALLFFTALQWHRSRWDFALPEQFLTHLFAVHNFTEATYYGINPSFWSLAVEIQFYLLYPLVLLIRHRFGTGRMLLVALVVSLTARTVGYSITDWNLPIRNTLWGGTATLWFDWVLGAYIAEQFVLGRRVFRHPILVAVLLGAMFVAMDSYRPTSQLCITIASLLSAVLIEAAVWSTAPARQLTRLLGRFGLFSYSFYLWHQPLIPIIYDKMGLARLPYTVERFAALTIVSLAIVSAISVASYMIIERPGQQIGRTKPRFVFGVIPVIAPTA